MKRVILVVLDSVGIGELPDAADYGDTSANTLINIKKHVPEMKLPNLISLGLSNIDGCALLADGKEITPKGAYAKLAEASKGKDTTTGHWEMAGLLIDTPFPTFPNGFPKDFLEKFEKKIGRKALGNCVASGTEIIERLGDLHVKTGDVIVYTSADSVFQVAAHEEVVSLEELYKICEIAREMLMDELAVSRVIARPFIGKSGNYQRTKNRKDYSLKPTGKTMLDYIKESGKEVVGIGKIDDIFAGIGLTKSVLAKENMDNVDKLLECMATTKNGLIFTNLVDFDMMFGHRRDVLGYSDSLMEFDNILPKITENLQENDILILTADHGCDPTFKGTDHTREYVPLIAYGKNIKENINLGIRNSFADIAKTTLEYLEIENDVFGESFLKEVIL